MATTMGKTMTTFWMDSRIPDDSRWHSNHEGEFRTSDRLADHFVGKLREECRKERSQVAIIPRFTRILNELLDSYESQDNLLLKLADTGRVAMLIHQYIDNALDMLDILDQSTREEWHNQLLIERKERLQVFENLVSDDKLLDETLGGRNQQLEIVTLLRYCVEKYHGGLTPYDEKNEKYRDKLTVAEIDTIAMVYDVVVAKAGIVSGELPQWFETSEHEWAWVNKAKLEDSKETWDCKAREKDANDKGSDEVRGEICEEVCVRLASIWTELNHPHLRKFYGASYVGKPFVIHETCFPPVFEKDLRRYVANCALGLQYVHDRGLVYHDVAPSTFLSSYSERRGVDDGLGLVPQSEADLSLHNATSGLRPSVTQDVLRFGISVFFLLANARNTNLGSDERDTIFDSWEHKTIKHLPEVQPQFIDDAEWEILQGLCALDPLKRTALVDAAFKMKLLVPEEKAAIQDEADQFGQPVADVSKYFVASFGDTLGDLMNETKDKCQQADVADSGTNSINWRVYHRFAVLYEQLRDSTKLVNSGLLLRFFYTLEAGADDLDSSNTPSRTVANMNSRFHHKIDHLIRSSPLLRDLCDGDTCHQWQPTWEQDQHDQRALFQSCLDNPEQFLDKVGSNQWTEAVAVMRFEAHNRPGAYSPHVVKKMKIVLEEAAIRAKKTQTLRDANVGTALPKWFVVGYQIELGKQIGEGGFGSVYYGKWFGTDVVVKSPKAETITTEDRVKFRGEADL